MSEKRRILIVENSLDVTGAFKSIFLISEILMKDLTIHFCIPSNSKLVERLAPFGFPVLRLPFVEISRSFLSLLLYVPMLVINSLRLLRYVRTNRVDVVHVNDLFNLTGIFLKRLRPTCKVIYHVRLMPDSYLRVLYPWLIRRVAGGADEVVFVSEKVRNACPLKLERSHIIYDGISSFERLPSKSIVESTSLKILYLANYTPGKGQELALEVFARAQASLPNATLSFVGGDMGTFRNKEFKKQLDRNIQQRGLTHCVWVKSFADDVEAVIKEHDILLNFSSSESFSMTCLEAMMYGTPVIATDSGGPGEILTPESGILIANGSIDAMCEAVVRLGSDLKLRQSLATHARAEARRRFSLERSAGQLRKLYEDNAGKA